MLARVTRVAVAALVTTLAAGCASEGNVLGTNLTTSSVGNGSTATAAAPKVDPACVSLTARIDALRKEGFLEGVEKASSGKSSTVSVKRASLAKVTELEKANAEFQARCSTIQPAQTAALAAPAAGAAVTPVKPAAAAAAAAPATASAVKAAAPAAVKP